MKKILFAIASTMSIAGLAYAGDPLEQRQQTVERLKEKYPCASFFHEVDQTLCGLYLEVLSRDKAPKLSEADWKMQIRETQAKLEEWKTETARIRNGLQPKLGMSKAYIYKHVLGAPSSINDSINSSGQTSQWVYETNEGTLYLYFDNKERLRSMQRSK